LTSESLERLLTDAIRRQQAAGALLAIAERVAEAGIEPMSMEEIDNEVKAVRAERRRPASGRDTNVLLSGLFWRGGPQLLIEQVRAGVLT
jgi:hypothetical protein